jgi:hypothetical protein
MSALAAAASRAGSHDDSVPSPAGEGGTGLSIRATPVNTEMQPE